MRLRTATIGLAAALIAATTAMSASADDKPVYGVLLKTLSNPFWGAMEQGIRDGAKEAGVEYFMQAVESDQAAEPQLNTCNTMLERKPKVMITAAINSTILLPCLKQANEMGIPVVDLDANLDHVMCRNLISVDWRGFVYDCDFNQMLDLPLRHGARDHVHLSDLLDADVTDLPIRVAGHCFGCTAGQGSSCGGALKQAAE